MPAAAFRANAGAALRRARTSRTPVIITERGRTTVVLVNAAAFERAEHQRGILKSLLRGEREIAAGRGHELDDVLADANDILRK